MSPHEELLAVTQRNTPPLEPEVRTLPARQQRHQPTASNASSSSTCSTQSMTDESEESYLDSLEEGRTPLLGESF